MCGHNPNGNYVPFARVFNTELSALEHDEIDPDEPSLNREEVGCCICNRTYLFGGDCAIWDLLCPLGKLLVLDAYLIMQSCSL